MTVSRRLSVVQLHIREDGRLFPVYQLLQQRQSSTTSSTTSTSTNINNSISAVSGATVTTTATHTHSAITCTTSKAMTQPEDNRPALPESLESIPKADYFPTQRHRWNTNEEIASILISFERHEDWLSKEVKIRPKSGSMLLYSRKRVRYRRDGYCWKKRKDGKTTREDHMKLKVQGTECIYGCYVHSAILPTFHRRCYWLLQNPDIVLVHYLNVPYSDDNKLLVTPSLSCCADKKEWTKEELVSQLKPMFYSENEPDLNNELEISTAETVEAIVRQLMEKQRAKSTARTHECACDNPPKGNASASASEAKKCTHTFHRIISPKSHSRGLLSTVSTAAGTSGISSSTTTTQATATISAVATSHSTSTKTEETKRATLATSVSVANCTPRHGSVILAPCRPVLQDGKHGEVAITSSQGSAGSSAAATSLILNLSQLQGGGGLLILNSATAAASVGLTSASVTPVTFLCGQDTTTAAAVRSIATSQALQSAMDTSDTPSTPMRHHIQQKSNHVKSELEDGMESALKRDVNFSNVPSSKDPDLCSVMEELTSEQKDISLSLFEDTLAMSHDDIQRTLSANLPPPKYIIPDSNPQISVKVEPHHSDGDPVDLNQMDFIDNDISTPDEEVFNMDTFDILSDLPNLDDLNPDLAPSSGLSSSSSTPVSTGSLAALKTNHGPNSAMNYREGTANITDYSPDWCYTEGGVKVLVTGPWYSSSSPYTILFDGVNVPTTLVQSGVLRCFSPAHEPGLVTLQVACEGFVISNSVSFEYRQRQSLSNLKSEDLFAVEENTLKLSLLERLEMIETKLRFNLDTSSSLSNSGNLGQNVSDSRPSFEDRLVLLCQQLMLASWNHLEDSAPMISSTCPDLTLLHLAAALGFSRLVCTLLQWRTENPSLILESEVDALSKDKQGCTPLMWACALGYTEAALLLYQWNKAAVKVTNHAGCTPLLVAAEQGHLNLVEQIEKLEFFQPQSFTESKSLDEDQLRNVRVTSQKTSVELPVKFPVELALNSFTTGTNSSKSKFITPSETHPKLSRYSSASNSSNTNCEHMEPPKLENETYNTASNKSVHSYGLMPPYLWFNDERQSSSKPERESSLNGRFRKDVATSPPNLSETNSESKKPFSDVVAISDEEPDEHYSTNATEGSTMSSRRDSCSSCDLNLPLNNEADNRVLTLAEHIIAAMPDRIKATANTDSDDIPLRRSEDFNDGDGGRLHSLSVSQNPSDLEMCPLDDSPPPLLSEEFNFDHTYRYCEVGTPASSLSPASSSCLQSPGSFTIDSPSPPPTTADFCEFFQASGKIMEKDFSKLTLSDKEQRELYEAAKIIQKAYRSYKGRKKQEEQEKEKAAATLIQTYYRRYKQYMYYKQMTKAAQLIQSQFRNYCEHKRFKKWKEGDADCISPVLGSSPNSNGPSAASLRSLYWTLAESERRLNSSREGTPTSSTLKRTYSQRRQHQAARKIQQFLRQSKNKLQRERALAVEREKQLGEAQNLPPLHRKYQEQLFDKKGSCETNDIKCDKADT